MHGVICKVTQINKYMKQVTMQRSLHLLRSYTYDATHLHQHPLAMNTRPHLLVFNKDRTVEVSFIELFGGVGVDRANKVLSSRNRS